MEPYLLTDRDEYQYCINRGYNPLIDIRNFKMDIRLRVEIQRELFGHCVFGRGANIMAAKERFFRWVWERGMFKAVTELFRRLLFAYIDPWSVSRNGA